MEPLTLLALAGAAALLFGSSKSGGSASDPSQEAVQADLKKLAAENPTGYSVVLTNLGPGANPTVMIQHAIGLYSTYPALANQLMSNAQKMLTPITGKSGTEWNTWISYTAPTVPQINNVTVCFGSTPILTYSQSGDDKNTRKLVKIEDGADSSLVARARADFL